MAAALSTMFDARVYRETLLNQTICEVNAEIDDWHVQQRTSLISAITSLISAASPPNPDFIAHAIANLDPSLASWTTSLHTDLRKYIRRIICGEVAKDTIDLEAQELLESRLLAHRHKVEDEVERSFNPNHIIATHTAAIQAEIDAPTAAARNRLEE